MPSSAARTGRSAKGNTSKPMWLTTNCSGLMGRIVLALAQLLPSNGHPQQIQAK
jgi:hypothetical protein